MKKSTFAALLLAGCSFAVPAAAQTSPTATDEIYNFDGFSDTGLLELFYKADQQGRKYPTDAEFEAAGISKGDIAFVRSHVRRRAIMSDEDRLNQDATSKRQLWMNIPMDVGSGGAAGYPGTKFTSDVFSMWNYTNLFGSWNHSVFQAPGCWVDAAHRNGTDIMSGIKFFESWTAGSGAGNWCALISTKNADGTYKYTKALINILMFFGSDGINYNFEDTGYSNADVVAFHKSLYKEAAAQGFDNFHIGIYTANSSLTAAYKEALFGSTDTGKTADLMLNYSGGDFTSTNAMRSSVQMAEAAMGTCEGLYTGVWFVSMDRSWTNLVANNENKRIGVCLWGEHGQSRFMSYNVGDGAFDTQENYQRLLERGFSGGNRNPLNRPAISNNGNNWERTADKLPLQTFCGLASFIPERSTIQGSLPFGTHFTLGNGERYFYKGKRTNGSWYNMGAQDLVPTYRWMVVNPGTTTVSTNIQPNYTHTDAYTGGSCLRLTGAAVSGGTDIVMYKTALKVSGSAPYAKVAVKNGKEGKNASSLYVILRKQGSGQWIEVPYGDVSGATWEEKTIQIAGLSTNDVIDRIGLRVKGNDNNYSLLVGKLEINDNSTVTPANVRDVMVEVKEETKTSMGAKIYWDVNAVATARAAWGLVYNDEANIDHFEILYKNGENGRVSEIGRTTSWSTYVGNIMFESAADRPFIGVRAVSTDLKTYSATEWVAVPRAAQSALPDRADNGNYGESCMDPACEGADIAREQRYVTSVTTTGATQNLNYSATGPVADGSQYADATDHVLKVAQGQTVSMNIKCADKSDGLKWCFLGGWMDLNGSGDFDKPLPTERTADEIAAGKTETDPEGERLFFAGTLRAATPAFQSEAGVTFSFTVPSDATPGPSRLRIVFSDAWFAGMFNPVGQHAKGFSIDFGVEITGTNPGRVVVDTRDKGVADQPEGFTQTGIDKLNDGSKVSTFSLEDGSLNLNNVDKAWIYDAEGKFVKFANGVSSVNVNGYAPGVYVLKMQSGNVIRSQKFIIK